MVNYKTDSTEYVFCKKYWWLEQPILRVFSTAHINMCTLPWAKPTPFSLCLPSPSSSQSILCIYRLGSRGSANWFCLAWKHTLVTWWHFSPVAISSQEWQADALQPAGSSSTKGSSQDTRGIVQPGSYLWSSWAGLLVSNSTCATHTALQTLQPWRAAAAMAAQF